MFRKTRKRSITDSKTDWSQRLCDYFRNRRKIFSSEQLAEKIDDLFQNYSTITFVIGGSYGLDASIKEKSDLSLSFSKMTFPHQLFRILLLEQIYRSYKIIHHESYHK